jgi:hypothetical protein
MIYFLHGWVPASFSLPCNSSCCQLQQSVHVTGTYVLCECMLIGQVHMTTVDVLVCRQCWTKNAQVEAEWSLFSRMVGIWLADTWWGLYINWPNGPELRLHDAGRWSSCNVRRGHYYTLRIDCCAFRYTTLDTTTAGIEPWHRLSLWNFNCNNHWPGHSRWNSPQWMPRANCRSLSWRSNIKPLTQMYSDWNQLAILLQTLL